MNHHFEIRHELDTDRNARELSQQLGLTILKYGLTLFLFFLIFIGAEMFMIVLSVVGNLVIWGKDIMGVIRRKKKYGKNWKWYKDKLFKEFIVIAILIVIGLFLGFYYKVF